MDEKIIEGIAASSGMSVGPVFIYQPPDLTIPNLAPESAEGELERFDQAVEQARSEIQDIKEKILLRSGQENAAIFDAHMLMLDDPMLVSKVRDYVDANKNIEQALSESTKELAGMLAAMEDEYFAARAADMEDVGRRVLRILLRVEDTSLDALFAPSIIIAQDLTPSDTAKLDPELVLAFCTAAGGLTSHTAILARTLGIPAVVGLGTTLLEHAKNGMDMVLDGSQGRVIINPSGSTQQRYREMMKKREAWLRFAREAAGKNAHTANGRRVEVGANIGDLESAKGAMQAGAEGVGLLRTEFLYLNETHPPSEERQIEVYKAIFDELQGRPVIVRTLDIGGDKPPTFLKFPDELNPFLGWRAIRICLDDEVLFKTQLRAILRSAVGHNVLIMYPMISSLEELHQANRLLEKARAELTAENLEYGKNIPVGIMVETPAAAVLTDVFAEACDFFSLGTNDLTQYTLAVDRTNERVANLFQPLHPAILRLIKQTIDAAHNKGIWVGMCGELAGMLPAIPILIGLGLDEFSMAPSSIPEAKWLIGQLSDERATKITRDVLEMHSASEIEVYMKNILGSELKLSTTD
jgi:phosphotransferase system enzyme I (PtsI)